MRATSYRGHGPLPQSRNALCVVARMAASYRWNDDGSKSSIE